MEFCTKLTLKSKGNFFVVSQCARHNRTAAKQHLLTLRRIELILHVFIYYQRMQSSWRNFGLCF